jgi:hypothetical protein
MGLFASQRARLTKGRAAPQGGARACAPASLRGRRRVPARAAAAAAAAAVGVLGLLGADEGREGQQHGHVWHRALALRGGGAAGRWGAARAGGLNPGEPGGPRGLAQG